MTLTASDTSRWRFVVPTFLSSDEIKPGKGTEGRWCVRREDEDMHDTPELISSSRLSSHRRHCTSWVLDQDAQKSWADGQPGLGVHLFSYTQVRAGFPSSHQTWDEEHRDTLSLTGYKKMVWILLIKALWSLCSDEDDNDSAFSHLVGIMSRKSSPGGQSFNFSTMGWPSLSFSRSILIENTPLLPWEQMKSWETRKTRTGTHWRWLGIRPRNLAPSHQKWWHNFYSWPSQHPGLQTPHWRPRDATSWTPAVYVYLTPTQATHKHVQIRDSTNLPELICSTNGPELRLNQLHQFLTCPCFQHSRKIFQLLLLLGSCRQRSRPSQSQECEVCGSKTLRPITPSLRPPITPSSLPSDAPVRRPSAFLVSTTEAMMWSRKFGRLLFSLSLCQPQDKVMIIMYITCIIHYVLSKKDRDSYSLI